MTIPHVVQRLGTNLHYWVSGDETSPVIALIHGATLDHHSFDAQVAPLVQAGFRVLAVDLRGHGLSVPLGPEINIGILADDLVAILDQMGVESLALAGHSFGGFVVQEFTRRYPERARSMTVIASTSLAKKSSPFMRLLYRVFPSILARMSLDTFRKRTLENLSESRAVMEYASRAMEGISKEEFTAITMAGIAALWLDSGFPPDYVVPKPFLLTHGELDRANGAVYRRESAAWAAREPNCRYEIIPGAGHTAHMDNPTAFNAVLLDFLNK